jgi:DNA-binding transcriptional ArsR family regulator
MPGSNSTKNRRGESTTKVRGLCALMANDVCRAVLVQLAQGPSDVTSMASGLGVSMSWLSHNLKRLLNDGVIEVQKRSQRRIYRLGPSVRAWRRNNRLTLELTTEDGGALTITNPASIARKRR